MKGDRPGEGEGRPGADDPEGKKNDADSGGNKGQQKGQRGEAVKQGKDGSDGRGEKSNQRGENRGQNDGQNQNKGDPKSGRDRPAEKDKSKQAQGDNENRNSSEGKESSERSDSGSSSKSSASSLRDFVSRVGPVLKWIVFALIGLAVLFFVLRSGLRFLANFSDWARRLLDALRNFWANLFGGRRQTTEEEEQDEQEEETLHERPFAAFPNPFAGGRSGMALPELIRYTFAAVQAWARERGLGRQRGETPLEFAERVGADVPALEKDLHRLSVLYARAVYARGGLPSDSVEVLRQFWQRLEAVAEQPLSA
jgi:hypothetical protein